MITQSNHNTIIERVKILLQLNELTNSSFILADVVEFLYRIKSFDEYESMSVPTSISVDLYESGIVMEWVKRNPEYIEHLSILLPGDQSINIEASYPQMDIKVSNHFPLNDDMANFVTTHLNNFKQPLKKKRYK